MVDPIELGRGRPVFYWWGLHAALYVGIAVALGLIALGAVLIKTSLGAEAEATAYRAAQPCTSVATTGCYLTEQGTVTSSDVTHANDGDRTNLEILVLGQTWSTWVATSSAAEDALQPGRSVMVQLYNDKITLVSVVDFNLTARDNPIRVAQDERLGGLLFVVIGLVLGGVCAVTLWRWHQRPPLWLSLLSPRGLDTASLIAAVGNNPGFIKMQTVSAPFREVPRPYTVRPQPSTSTGSPWWMAPVALAVGFPWIALRYGAPMQVLAITVIAGVTAAMLVVVIHTMYARNRRLVVDELDVTQVNMWGQKTIRSRSEIARVGLPTLRSFATRPILEPRVVMVGHDGQLVLSLPHYFLSSAQAADLAAAVQAPFDPSMNQMMSRRTMERQWPGSVTWFERHIVLITVVLVPVLCAFGVFFVWAIDGFK
jgi:hypothetical protein